MAPAPKQQPVAGAKAEPVHQLAQRLVRHLATSDEAAPTWGGNEALYTLAANAAPAMSYTAANLR